MPNEIFPAKTRKNVAQDCSVLSVHEDLSNEFDEVDCRKNLIRQQSLIRRDAWHKYSNRFR
ncbi:MAG: hypothetical protein LBT70_03875 [Holosporaceae bacterium]|nr:hypothetical protein [Holosporaceae bacterium]